MQSPIHRRTAEPVVGPTVPHPAALLVPHPAATRSLVATMRYELVPIKSVEHALAALPTAAPVSVTCSPAKGLPATLDLTARLLDLGHDAVPHLAARQVEGPEHVARLARWIREHDVREVFVVAGDAPHAAGPYGESIPFLRRLLGHGAGIERVGIPGYPDGHPLIPDVILRDALRDKEALLAESDVTGSVTTQMCFDPARVRQWLLEARTRGLELPVELGIPGVVHRTALMTMGVRLGVGASLRYLRKNRAMVRMLQPGHYDPSDLVDALAGEARVLGITGVHAFTFNAVGDTAAWQRSIVESGVTSSSADAVVIGAGVIGAAVALELARTSRSVTVVDKGPAAGSGSTSASSSIIRFSYSTPDAVLTAWESAAIWRNWSAHLGVDDPDGLARFVRTGYLGFLTPGYDLNRVLGLWDAIGIPYERLDAAQLRGRWPGLDVGAYWPPKRIDDPAFGDDATAELAAFYEDESGYIDDPMLAAHNLAHAARHHGAEFRFRETVVEVGRAAGRVTGVGLASGDTVSAPVVVNVAGPHSPRINEMAGVVDEMRIRHRALRQEVFAVPAPRGFALAEGGPVVADLDIGQYFRPQAGGTLLVGGTEPECDPLEWVDDPDHFNEQPTVEHWETYTMRLARRLPEFGIPNRPVGLAALYDASDDWVPIYDRSSLDGYFMACGTSGNQFKNAPMVGRFITALVDAAAAGIDHDADPVQFTGPLTGRPINLGAFSRCRDPAVTSGTVMG